VPFSHEPLYYDQETGEIFWEINRNNDSRRVVGLGGGGGTGGGSYTLPVATASRLGGVKASSSVLIAADGTATVPAATAATPGLAQLADLAAITAGTAGRLVDAAQLKTAVAAGGGGGGTLTGVRGTAPITVDNTDPLAPLVAVATATAGALGVVRLADAAAITAGTAGRIVDAAQLKAAAYVLKAATTAAIGGVKPGTNLTVAADGTLSANIPGALVYKGGADPTAAPPTGVAVGAVYVSSKAGTAAAGWTGIAGQTIRSGDLLLYNGSSWTANDASIGVTSVTAAAPITVDSSDPAAPRLTVAAATDAAAGIVQLADAAAITAGTANRIVDAAQLKAVKDAVGAYLPLDFSTLAALP
jgi:hypothetical protein